MSGFLRWQAERALGQASGVRPARQPPGFAAGPSRSGDAAAAFASPGDFGTAERPFDAPSPDLTRPARADAMPATPRAPAAPLSDTPRTPVAPVPAPTDDVAVTTASQYGDAPAPHAQPPSAADRRGERADRSAIDDRGPRDRPLIADDKTPPDFSSRRGLVPQPIPRIAARLARNRPAGDASEARLAASPAPDVHIHIGRVELTAIAAAAPRRESAANAKKPMSLEEYLRRRSGRPS